MNEEKVLDWRRGEFEEIRGKMKLKTGRAWAINESLIDFWDYSYPNNSEKYLKRFYFWATHNRLKPVIKEAKTLKHHLPNILTYFKHRIANPVTEGLNSKIQTIKQMACGLRNREHYRKAILFHCRGLNLYTCSSSKTGAFSDTTICGMAHTKL